ncbi:MAG: aminomethyl-transferring glycine dehydrogenase subunit GcvPA, partial [Promethearchaeota archaeon]
MDFSPLTESDIKEMLKETGVSKIDDLFVDVPKSIKNIPLKLDEGKSELEVYNEIKRLAEKNKVYGSYFCGAGIYRHYIPPVVEELTHRNEFYTSYTPYEAEVSQGFLQAIFEYQTAICNLTGMDATNASVYDGATAITESLIMARNITRKNTMIILQPINPEYKKVIDTYAFSGDIDVIYANLNNFEDFLQSDKTAAVVFQNPDFLGRLWDVEGLIDKVKSKSPRTLVIYTVGEATSLGALKRPGSIAMDKGGVDIVCGEAQALGLPMNYGGPLMGFIATRKKYMRKLPGRIVGKTKEINGDAEGYILTLQAREQHIRREKALSNICSNEALCMLQVYIYLATLGYSGLRRVAELNIKNTYYLIKRMEDLNLLETLKLFHAGDENHFSKNKLGYIPFYNEFLVECNKGIGAKIYDQLEKNNIMPPLLLDKDVIRSITSEGAIEFDDQKDYLLICNTEMNTKEDIDRFVEIIKE